jgi:hypothetical protein
MTITNPTPGGSFGGDGSAVSASGRTPGGQFIGAGVVSLNGSGLSDTILWIGPEPPSGDGFILWINTSDGRWYGYWNDGTSTQWVDMSLPFGEGLPGPKGLQGDTGEKGDVGLGIPVGGAAEEILVKIDGTDFNTYWGLRPADGNLIVYGTVDPTTEGNDGDAYINTTTSFYFGPKAAGVWPAGIDLTGATGPTGNDGTQIVYGIIAPTTEGNDGDTYIDTVTDTIYYEKTGGSWPAGVSLIGSAGADGIDGTNGTNGVDGTDGVDGDIGPQGDAGTDGSDGANGVGVPTGGTTDQVLAKIDGTDYNTQWVTAASGGGGGTGVPHRYWRISPLTSGNASYVGMGDLEMREEALGADVTSEAQAMEGSRFSSQFAELAFDANPTGTHWLTAKSNPAADIWIGQDFGDGVERVIKEIQITARLHGTNFNQTPDTFTIDHSDDGVNWSILETFSAAAWTTGSVQTFSLPLQSGDTFTDLADTPGDYVGKAGQVVAVNSGEAQLEFLEPSDVVPLVYKEVTANYSTIASDFAGHVVLYSTAATAITITVEPSMSATKELAVVQDGAGTITFAGGTGVTLKSPDSLLDTRVQESMVVIMPTQTSETYRLGGDLA